METLATSSINASAITHTEAIMQIQIVFYSSTGNTRKAAQQLASALGVTALEITCNTYTSGFFGRFRQAWDIMTGGSPPIEVPLEAIQPEIALVVGCPVWSAKPAPPMRTFLRQYARDHKNIAAFVTCRGTSESHPPENALTEMQQEISASLRVTGIFKEAEITDAQFPEKMATFADALKRSAQG